MNPFTFGNPISSQTRFLGRTREAGQVLTRLRNNEFESTSIVGDRRIGKTSLLLHLARPEVRAAHDLDGTAYAFVYEDLQLAERSITPTRLWQRLLRKIARHCQDPSLRAVVEHAGRADPIDSYLLDEVFDELDDRQQRVVLLLDEFEHITQNENFDVDFFYGLRSIAIHHGLALVTSSRRELVDLCHSETIRSSPFFNIFAQVDLPLLTIDEATRLISSALAGTDVVFTADEIEAVLALAGTHPFFLQAAGHFLYDAHLTALDAAGRRTELVRRFRREAAGHFEDAWIGCDDHEQIVLTALALVEHGDDDAGSGISARALETIYERSEQTLAQLHRRGIVVTAGNDDYRLFSSLLGEWILGELAAAMSERQTYAGWIAERQDTLGGLSAKAKGELGTILPQIGSQYRELIVSWASDPRRLGQVMALLKGAFGG